MKDGARIRVFSVDDHPLFREGLAAVIDDQPDMRLVAQASTGKEAIASYEAHRPDVTVMDLRLPDMSGTDALIAIRMKAPDARILMLTTFAGGAEIQRALAAGARGYLLKATPPPELVTAIRQVHAGKRRVPPEIAAQLAETLSDDRLSSREIEVLLLVAEGNRNQDIAARLCISEDTVKTHLKHILLKLGAADRTQAVTLAVRRGIIQL